MFKDYGDSKRYNASYRRDLKDILGQRNESNVNYLGFNQMNINPLILSSGFWPVKREHENFKFPKKIKEVFDQFENSFHIKHGNKIIEWHDNLGSVEIELEFPAGISLFKCQPIQAIIISFFDEEELGIRSKLKLSEICKKLEVKESKQNYVRHKLFFWIKRKVLKEVKPNSGQSEALLTSSGNFTEPKVENLENSKKFEDEKDYLYELAEDLVPYDYNNDEEEEEQGQVEGLDHECITKESLINRDELEGAQNLEIEIMNILHSLGPKKLQKIGYLIETIFRPKAYIKLGDNQLENILNMMIKRGKVLKDNNVYYAAV